MNDQNLFEKMSSIGATLNFLHEKSKERLNVFVYMLNAVEAVEAGEKTEYELSDLRIQLQILSSYITACFNEINKLSSLKNIKLADDFRKSYEVYVEFLKRMEALNLNPAYPTFDFLTKKLSSNFQP